MAVFDPNRRRTARGEQRQAELLRAAAAVFSREGYHATTTNAIAAEAGVSPATLYQFFPNKDAIASEIIATNAREMAAAERQIDPQGVLSWDDAVRRLLDLCMRYNRRHPEFHTLVLNAELSENAQEAKQELGRTFIDFISERLRRAQPGLSAGEAAHHGSVALLIFRGILDELTNAAPAARVRLQRAMHDAILRYLEPLVAQE